MKKFLPVLITSLLWGLPMAAQEQQTATIDYSQKYSTSTNLPDEDFVVNNITVAKVSYSTTTSKYVKWDSSSNYVAMYNGNSLKITPSEGVTIFKVTFTCPTGTSKAMNYSDNSSVSLDESSEGTYSLGEWSAETGTTKDIILNVSSSNSILSAAAFTAITITYTSSATLKDPGLAFSASEATIYKYEGAVYNLPSLTAPDGVTVKYSSSDTSVADFDASGNLTAKAAGKTVITATSEKNDTYDTGKAEYSLYVVDPAKIVSYDKVTDLSSLVAGAKIVLVDEVEAAHVAMGTAYKTANQTFQGASVTIVGGKISELTADVAIFEVEISTDGKYALKFTNGDNTGKYLYVVESGQKFISASDAAVYTSSMTLNADGSIAVGYTNGSDERFICYLNGESYFAAYGATEAEGYGYVTIYVETTSTYKPAAPTGSYTTDSGSTTLTSEVTYSNSTTVTFDAVPADAAIWYKFTANQTSGEQTGGEGEPTQVIAKVTTNADGFTQYESSQTITITETGKLEYYTEQYGQKSDITTVYFTNSDTTGVEDILVGNDEQDVEYFDLSGRRVVNPSNGIFIRRIGNSVTKIRL